MGSRTAQILFPVNVPGAFDYAVPDPMRLSRGEFVFAPIGKQMKLGVVMSLGEAEPGRALKEIAEIKATRALPLAMLDFIDWVARYNVASPGQVLRMVLRSWKALDPSPVATLYEPTGDRPLNLTPARRAALSEGGPFPARASEIAARAGISPGVVKGLVKTGLMRSELRPVDAPYPVPNPDRAGRDLTEAQSVAARELVTQVQKDRFSVSLLDGVTGSGKTEVYFEAVAEALRQGRQVLILVPEIALTQAGLARFAQRFGAEPVAWHSSITDTERRRGWREVASGRAQLVVGARSALFLPFAKLGLIVVDEEHDTSFKQEEGVIYNARDMSVLRGRLEDRPVILASATPSLESLHNAQSGRYAHIVLPERPGAITLPDIDLIDMKVHKPETGAFLSAPMVQAVADSISRGEQSLLYMNRRGYAPLILCRACGERLKSPDTDSWLVEHRATGRAVCHLTGFSMRMPRECPKCGAEDGLTSIGPGVERIADEIQTHFPQTRVEILSSDTTATPDEIKARLGRMEQGEIDILVGTQMVVKGHNFPKLTFVGVVDGDLLMGGADPRAGERTYQTLVQVAGRAGRADKAGEALIQTHHPEHEALQALVAGDRDLFVGVEMAMREMLGLPPYGRIAAVILWGPDLKKVKDLAKDFVTKAPRADGVEILGPSEAPIARLRGLYRQRLFIRADPDVNLSKYMTTWRAKQKRIPTKYKIQIDIDPQSFM
ncbi:primosomal protein N' [Algimonas porphyrae]|uniref:Replication restart protein PriA n=1 Tax=Algimonas porphyrae TaxID=1128113 RepID=A0ABQ5UYU0_9PROT|nr:primosomal protein N' [Algimonas porphyrae]GLQ19930.1 primosomal protein N' [Algimonas porphyrae]